MPESRLLGRLPDGRSRAAAGHEFAALVACAAQGVEDRGLLSAAPEWRLLPFEGPFVVGDQIGVTGRDLVAACARAEFEAGGEAVMVWAPPGVGRGPVGIGVVLESVLRGAEELGRGL
jgi:hypothetical protein